MNWFEELPKWGQGCIILGGIAVFILMVFYLYWLDEVRQHKRKSWALESIFYLFPELEREFTFEYSGDPRDQYIEHLVSVKKSKERQAQFEEDQTGLDAMYKRIYKKEKDD